jgi:hypothetical protein
VRRSLIGVLFGAFCCVLAAAERGNAQVGQPGHETQSSSATAGNLITHITATDGQPLTVTVIDVRNQALATYQIDRQTGEITLKGVRNISWDLQMINFNTAKPLPQEVRSGLQK